MTIIEHKARLLVELLKSEMCARTLDRITELVMQLDAEFKKIENAPIIYIGPAPDAETVK